MAEGPFWWQMGHAQIGFKVICVALADSAESALQNEVDVFYEVPLARPGKSIKKLRQHDVTTTIMVGRVAKVRIYTPWRILRYLPDWRAFRIWYWRLRKKDTRNDTILNALAQELASGGIILEDSTMYCKEHLATEGVMTSVNPSPFVKDDVEFGWPIAKKLGEMDIGQAIAVKEKEIIAVEAIEGTAKMIERAGKLCSKGAWTLIKVAKPNQDMRFDVPCIGIDTIKGLAENGGKCIVIEAGKTIIIDKPQTIKLANKMGISIVGC